MPTSHFVYSNFFSRKDIIKHVAITHGKALLIDALRELFTGDSVYPYRIDEFGYPLVLDHTALPNEDAGTEYDINGNLITNPSSNLSIDGQLSTKILITDILREDVKFYPVITIKNSGGSYSPISFNQNEGCIHYRVESVRDAYGNESLIRTPTHFVYDGAWEQNFEVKIVAQSHGDRDEIADIVSIGLQHVMRDKLIHNGLFIKKVTFNGEDQEEYTNGYVYSYSFSLNTYSEWSREVPISNIIERINIYFDVLRSGIRPSNGVDSDLSLNNNFPSTSSLVAIIT